MLHYFFYLFKNNPRKYIVSQIIMILVDILIVKGSISFIEEKTGYSLLFPIFILVLVSLLQFWILFFCFYVKEILGQSFVFKEEIMLENQTLRGYQNRESLVFLEEVMQLAIQLFLLSFFSRNKDMYIVILTVNGIASLIIYYILNFPSMNHRTMPE